MPEIETVTIDLPRAVADELRRCVENGEFTDPSAAVQAALEEWRRSHSSQGYSASELRRLADEGIASGPTALGSMADLKKEARRRWAARTT